MKPCPAQRSLGVVILLNLGTFCGVNVQAASSAARALPAIILTVSSTDGIPISTGEAITLTLTLRNTWNKREYVSYGPGTTSYEYQIQWRSSQAVPGAAMTDVPMTAAGRVLLAAPTYGGGVFSAPQGFDIPPGDEAYTRVVISRLFDISQPGIYVIQVKRRAVTPSWSGPDPKNDLVAEPVTIQVSPGAGALSLRTFPAEEREAILAPRWPLWLFPADARFGVSDGANMTFIRKTRRQGAVIQKPSVGSPPTALHRADTAR